MLSDLNMDTYLCLYVKANKRLSATEIVRLLREAKRRRAPAVPVEVKAGPSDAKKRRDQLAASLSKHARPAIVQKRELDAKHKKLKQALAEI